MFPGSLRQARGVCISVPHPLNHPFRKCSRVPAGSQEAWRRGCSHLAAKLLYKDPHHAGSRSRPLRQTLHSPALNRVDAQAWELGWQAAGPAGCWDHTCWQMALGCGRRRQAAPRNSPPPGGCARVGTNSAPPPVALAHQLITAAGQLYVIDHHSPYQCPSTCPPRPASPPCRTAAPAGWECAS